MGAKPPFKSSFSSGQVDRLFYPAIAALMILVLAAYALSYVWSWNERKVDDSQARWAGARPIAISSFSGAKLVPGNPDRATAQFVVKNNWVSNVRITGIYTSQGNVSTYYDAVAGKEMPIDIWLAPEESFCFGSPLFPEPNCAEHTLEFHLAGSPPAGKWSLPDDKLCREDGTSALLASGFGFSYSVQTEGGASEGHMAVDDFAAFCPGAG